MTNIIRMIENEVKHNYWMTNEINEAEQTAIFTDPWGKPHHVTYNLDTNKIVCTSIGAGSTCVRIFDTVEEMIMANTPELVPAVALTKKEEKQAKKLARKEGMKDTLTALFVPFGFVKVIHKDISEGLPGKRVRTEMLTVKEHSEWAKNDSPENKERLRLAYIANLKRGDE